MNLKKLKNLSKKEGNQKVLSNIIIRGEEIQVENLD